MTKPGNAGDRPGWPVHATLGFAHDGRGGVIGGNSFAKRENGDATFTQTQKV